MTAFCFRSPQQHASACAEINRQLRTYPLPLFTEPRTFRARPWKDRFQPQAVIRGSDARNRFPNHSLCAIGIQQTTL